jgi:hypothetical protein
LWAKFETVGPTESSQIEEELLEVGKAARGALDTRDLFDELSLAFET